MKILIWDHNLKTNKKSFDFTLLNLFYDKYFRSQRSFQTFKKSFNKIFWLIFSFSVSILLHHLYFHLFANFHPIQF